MRRRCCPDSSVVPILSTFTRWALARSDRDAVAGRAGTAADPGWVEKSGSYSSNLLVGLCRPVCRPGSGDRCPTGKPLGYWNAPRISYGASAVDPRRRQHARRWCMRSLHQQAARGRRDRRQQLGHARGLVTAPAAPAERGRGRVLHLVLGISMSWRCCWCATYGDMDAERRRPGKY